MEMLIVSNRGLEELFDLAAETFSER